jgi:hypothetical protein
MKYNINISPAWIGELGLIDDWGPEIDPKDIPVGTTRAVAVKLKSGRVHLISWKHVKDLPADDPAVAAVLVTSSSTKTNSSNPTPANPDS